MPPFRTSVAWYLVAVACAGVIGAPGPVYWDSFGYVTQALTGEIGGLGVGRPVFAIGTHLIATAWQWFGGAVWSLELVLRVACLLVSACAAPLSHRMALEAGLRPRAAHLTAAFVAASPAFAHTSATVLTDGPATAFVLLTWVATLRAVRRHRLSDAALAGLWFGLAIGLREASLFAAVTCLCLGWGTPMRARLRLAVAFAAVAAVVVVAPMLWAFATQPGYVETIRHWLNGMAHDSELKSWDLRTLGLIGYWLVLFGPVALLLTGLAIRRWRDLGPWRVTLVAPAWAQWAVMITYQGIAYSPRYLMSAFPAAMALPAGWMLDRLLGARPTRAHRAAVVLALLAPLVAGRFVSRAAESDLLAVSSGLIEDLASVPADAVIVTGHACPAIPMIRQLARLEPRDGLVAPAWTEICPGWGWPEDLSATLEAHADAGRLVVLDLRAHAWRGDEQLRSLAQLRQYWLDRGIDRPGRVVAWGAGSF